MINIGGISNGPISGTSCWMNTLAQIVGLFIHALLIRLAECEKHCISLGC